MTFQIGIEKAKEKQVLQIIYSLQEAGLIQFVRPLQSLALEGDVLAEDELANILQDRADKGHFLTQEEAKKFFQFWKETKNK